MVNTLPGYTTLNWFLNGETILISIYLLSSRVFADWVVPWIHFRLDHGSRKNYVDKRLFWHIYDSNINGHASEEGRHIF